MPGSHWFLGCAHGLNGLHTLVTLESGCQCVLACILPNIEGHRFQGKGNAVCSWNPLQLPGMTMEGKARKALLETFYFSHGSLAGDFSHGKAILPFHSLCQTRFYSTHCYILFVKTGSLYRLLRTIIFLWGKGVGMQNGKGWGYLDFWSKFLWPCRVMPWLPGRKSSAWTPNRPSYQVPPTTRFFIHHCTLRPHWEPTTFILDKNPHMK